VVAAPTPTATTTLPADDDAVAGSTKNGGGGGAAAGAVCAVLALLGIGGYVVRTMLGLQQACGFEFEVSAI
jgi:hypothetical protein